MKILESVRLRNSTKDPRKFEVLIKFQDEKRERVAIYEYFADGIVDHWSNAFHYKTWKRTKIVMED